MASRASAAGGRRVRGEGGGREARWGKGAGLAARREVTMGRAARRKSQGYDGVARRQTDEPKLKCQTETVSTFSLLSRGQLVGFTAVEPIHLGSSSPLGTDVRIFLDLF